MPGVIMKIYLFHPETGCYLGEDFADESPIRGGAPVLPPDATTIAPPKAGRGEVPVFNAGKKLWEVHPVPLSELNRPAGADSDSGKI